MRRVCICENVHFRFIYTPSLVKNRTSLAHKFFWLSGNLVGMGFCFIVFCIFAL